MVLIGAVLFVYSVLGPVREQLTAADVARQPGLDAGRVRSEQP